MPIRMPNYGPSSSGPTPQGVSPSAAVAPGLALGAVARGLGAVGDELEAHDQRIQEVQNSADITEIKTKMKTAYAEFQAGLADRSDHQNYLSEWNKKLDSVRKSVSDGNYSQLVLDRANQAFIEFEGNSRIGVASAAQSMAVKRQKQAFANGFDLAVNGYDPMNPSDQDFNDLMEDHPGTPEEKEALRRQWEESTRNKRTLAEIHEDPAQWLKENPNPGRNPAEWDLNTRRAKQVLAGKQRDQSDEVIDLIYGDKLTDPKQIEALTPDLGAAARARLKEIMANRGDEELQRMMREPEFQMQTAGEVAAAIDGYEPTGESRDLDYVEIRNKINMLPSGPLKQEFERELKGIREGKEKEIESVRDWAFTQVDEAYKSGRLTGGAPEKPQGRSLGSYLASGILTEADTLKKFGFKPEHADAIAEAAEAEREAELKGETHKGPSAVDLFRRHYMDGGEAVEDFSYKLREVFEAINQNKGPTHMVIDPADRWKFESESKDRIKRDMRAYGRARSEVAEFLKLNPNPTMEKASEFLEGIKVDVEAGETDAGFEPKPGSGGDQGPRGARAMGDSNASDVVSFVKGFEGWNSSSYWDYGQQSIGYGTKAKPGEESISKAEAERRLKKELSSHRQRVEEMNKKGGYNFTPAQMDALTSFDYNTGKLEQLTAGGTRDKREIAEKILLYRNAGGAPLRGLIKRRKAERDLFLNGY